MSAASTAALISLTAFHAVDIVIYETVDNQE
jgi:hypothetical protein